MNRWAMMMVAAAAVGCGAPEGVFVPEFTSAYCDAYMGCTDEALLTFDGILAKEDCENQFNKAVFDWGRSCRYKKSKAKQCLDALSTYTCPSEGTDVWDALPAICEEVYPECGAFDPFVVSDDADTTTGDETGGEGGGGEETGGE